MTRPTTKQLVVMGILAALLVVVGGYYAAGGRWWDVRTPSMGTAAPVGSLVLTTPVQLTELRTDDIISFTTSVGTPGRVYTHRVTEVTDSGVKTKGDINAVGDPWVLTQADLVGRSWAVWNGFGYLLRSVPILILGGLITWLLGRFVIDRHYRYSSYLMGAALTISTASVVHRPFLNLGIMTYAAQNDGGVSVSVVNTGILPLRAQADGGTHVDLVSGQLGVVTTNLSDNGLFRIDPVMHMGIGWWIFFIAFCLWPLLYVLIIGLPAPADPKRAVEPPPADPADEPPAEPTSGPSGTPTATTPGPVAVVAVTLALATLAASWGLGETGTQAAFTATVRNSTDTARSRTYANCLEMASLPPSAFLAYGMRPDKSSGTLYGGMYEEDLTGNSRRGDWDYLSNWQGSIVGSVYSKTGTRPCASSNSSADMSYAQLVSPGLCLDTPSTASMSNPTTFTIESWFSVSTTATNGMKIAGFSNQRTGVQSQNDRNIYIGRDGKLYFAVYPGAVRTISSPGTVSDGNWHYAVATLSSAGMRLYLDGSLVASNATVTSAQNFATGYWKFACGKLDGWPSGGGTEAPFFGKLGFTAIYTTAFSAMEVQDRYNLSKP